MEATAIQIHKQSDWELGHINCSSNLKLNLQTRHLGIVGSSARSQPTAISIPRSNIAPVIHCDGEMLDHGKGAETHPSFNQTGTYSDPILDTLTQDDRATRKYHQPRANRGTLGADTEESVHTGPDKGLLLSAERQARMNLTNGEIRRLMPRDRKIRFNVDEQSFLDANIPEWAIECFISDALEVSGVFTRKNLGITFLYTNVPGDEVFIIRYSRGHNSGNLAQSFFPSDPLRYRQVLIFYNAMSLAYGFRYSKKMQGILAHEFTHILGFRHWHAGSDSLERMEPSKLWPGTTDDDRNTIMCSPWHSRLDFSKEDFRVIRELYLVDDGDIIDGCMVVDVDPDAPRFVS